MKLSFLLNLFFVLFDFLALFFKLFFCLRFRNYYLICGSFVTAGDARTMLKEHVLGDLARPKAERVNPADLTPEGAVAAESGDDGDGTAGPALDADEDFATDANPDFADSDFGIFDVAKAQAELEQDAQAIVDKVSGGAKDES